MILYITDANVFIDLHHAGALDMITRLGLSIVTTQLVFDELNEEQGVDLQLLVSKGEIQILAVSIEEILAVALPKGLSLPDRSVICLAIREKGVMISNDELVRRTAGELGIGVHGLLWLFDEFVEKNLIPPSKAAEILEFLVFQKGSRQPIGEVESRLKRWKGDI